MIRTRFLITTSLIFPLTKHSASHVVSMGLLEVPDTPVHVTIMMLTHLTVLTLFLRYNTGCYTPPVGG